MSRETALLGTLTLRLPQPVERQRGLLAAAAGPALLESARREGLAGLLYANLRRAGLLGLLSHGARDELEADHLRTAARNLQKQAALRELARRLGETGTEVIALKGIALLDELYDDPGTRATGDIDLYAASRAHARLSEALRVEGFVPQPLYPDTFRRGAVEIDLHTHVLGAGRVRARADILAGGEAPLLADLRPTAYGEAVCRLRPAAELLVACLHLMKHNADRLLWLIEINERVAALDEPTWRELVALCEAAGQRATLIRVAWLGDLLLPGTVATRLSAWAASHRPPRFERRALRRRATHGGLPAWAPLLFFAPQRGAVGRAASLFETLFPRPAVLRQVFADEESSAWRLYARRIAQLVALALR